MSAILVVAVACILWGLKLETELNTERSVNTSQARRIERLEVMMENGILPRAEERIQHLNQEIDEHKEHHDRDH